MGIGGTISHLNSDFPLGRCFLIGEEGLSKSFEQIELGKNVSSNPKDFFGLDPDLPRCKKLISLSKSSA